MASSLRSEGRFVSLGMPAGTAFCHAEPPFVLLSIAKQRCVVGYLGQPPHVLPSRLNHYLPMLQGYFLTTKSHTNLEDTLDMAMRPYLGCIPFMRYLC